MRKFQAYIVLVILCIWGACKKSTSQEPTNPTDAVVTVTPKPDVPVGPDTTHVPDVPIPANASISGKVAPLEIVKIAKVVLYNTPQGASQEVSLNNDGSFVIANLRAGTYRLAINTGAVRGDANMQGITLNAGQVKDLQTIMLGLGSGGYTVYGNSAIMGKIQPANGAHSVVAYQPELQSQYVGVMDAGGNFTIKDLPEGTFTVGVNAAQYFTATGSKQIVLTRNQTADAGTFMLYSDKDPGSPNYLAYELNGVQKYKEPVNGANYLAPHFSLSTYKQTTVTIISLDMRSTVVADKLDIILDELNGTGTYVTRGTVKSQIKLTHRDIKSAGIHGYTAGPVGVWSTVGSGGTATVTITAIDAVNHTISGTFTATMVPESGGATGSKLITNGAFAQFKYSPAAP